jgi:hypothetical protein
MGKSGKATISVLASARLGVGCATAGLPSSAKIDYTQTMELQPVYRKKVQHFNEPNQLHELTFSCYKRLPLLTNDAWRLMFTDSIDRAMQRHRYRLPRLFTCLNTCTY